MKVEVTCKEWGNRRQNGLNPPAGRPAAAVLAAGQQRQSGPYAARTPRRRRALPTTLTEERLIARAATIGDSSKPKAG